MSDYEAAAKLCELHAGRLAGFLVTRGTDPALVEDIIQDTFLVLCRKGDEVLTHPNPVAYLYKIARGIAADRRRANESRCSNERTWHHEQGDQLSHRLESVADDMDVRAALAQLSPRQQEVVFLYRCADFALDEVADILHISKGAAKSHLQRGEAHLRRVLGDQTSEELS